MRDNRVSEVLLHFIWQFRYFNHRELATEAGDPLFIHYPGDPNTDHGPDFKNARIAIGDTTAEGAVELHRKTSDWLRHGHTGDPHYKNVLLHVVWENDAADPPAGVPILQLRDRTPKLLLPRYQQFMTSQSFVPCERSLPATIQWAAFRQTLLTQRLDHRAAFIRTLLDERSPHWDQTIFYLIARSLGQPVNTDAFLKIAQSFPLSTLLRRRTEPARLENLFLEQAARLDLPLSFSRMRPAHQPPVRLAQLAAILSRYTGWFTTLIESDHPAAILKTLDIAGLGAQTKRSILINAHIPFLYAFSILRQELHQRDKALRWLHETPPENNTIIRRWQQIGMTAHSAADTQALLELRKNYCSEKKCLGCGIGRQLLTANPAMSPRLTPLPANEIRSSPPSPDGYYT
ncbi:MAG TPA: DUF2851 family protein [Puia sp.]|nr:DUF2851 family protein [Puia sp.]